MDAFLPSIGVIAGLASLVAAVRLTEHQARSARLAVVERRDERRHDG